MALLLVAGALAPMTGCRSGGQVEAWRYPRPAGTEPKLGTTITLGLRRHFGTPRHPRLPGSRLSAEQLREGARRYRWLCLGCHGLAGEGLTEGTTAPGAAFLSTDAFDWRPGVFKFTSTGPDVPPTREDLLRSIREGVPGTSMLSYAPYGREELMSMVEHVRLLAMRGQAERHLVDRYDKHGRLEDGATEAAVKQVVERWEAAEKAVVEPSAPRPRDTAAAAARGADLFVVESDCTTCHGDRGRGDGDVEYTYRSTEASRLSDFTTGVYCGGGSPVDLFRRVLVGVKGTEMPGYADDFSEEEIWDLVEFMLSVDETEG